jgi:hypothetical protein
MIERRIHKFFPHFVEVTPVEGFVLLVGAKLYSVSLVHHYISISVSVTPESSRAQHSLGCAVSKVL